MKSILIITIIFATVSSCGTGVDSLNHTGVCAGYPEESTSPYKLPYTAGTSHRVSQSNCTQFTHSGSSRYAYDLSMSEGTDVLAIRAGTVLSIEMDYDNGRTNGVNYIRIEHSDGTVAGYGHLLKDSQTVSVGESVTQGQMIASSGWSGITESAAHLHLSVRSSEGGETIPLTFSNTSSHPKGLVDEQTYTAQ